MASATGIWKMSQLELWHSRGSHFQAWREDLISTGVSSDSSLQDKLFLQHCCSTGPDVTFTVCRAAFAFVYLATAYVCWLLLKYYQVSRCHPVQLFCEAAFPLLVVTLWSCAYAYLATSTTRQSAELWHGRRMPS